MNRHDAYDVRVLIKRICLAHVDLLRAHLIKIAKEPEQPGIRSFFEADSHLQQHRKIREPLTAGRKSGYIIFVAGLGHKLFEELMDRQISETLAAPVEFFEERAAAGAEVFVGAAGKTGTGLPVLLRRIQGFKPCISCHCCVVVCPPAESPDFRRVFFREAAEIPVHRSVERDVLTRVVENTKILHDLPYFFGREIAGPRRHVAGDSLLLENAAEFLIPAGRRAKQDDDIPVPDRTEFLRPFVGHTAAPDQFMDPLCNRQCLPLSAVKIHKRILLSSCPGASFTGFVSFRKRCFPAVRTSIRLPALSFINDQQLGLRIVKGQIVPVSAFEACRLIVIDTADFRPHDPAENCIDGIQDFLPRPEIRIKVNALRPVIVRPVGCIFFHENFGPRETELIYALFYITDHKPVVPALRLARDNTKQQLLHIVRVLILIDQDFRKMCAVHLGRRFWRNRSVFVSFRKNLQCQVFEVVKINDVLVLLGLSILCLERENKSDQLVQRALYLLHFRGDVVRRAAEIKSLVSFHPRPDILAARGYGILQVLIDRVVLLRALSLEGAEHKVLYSGEPLIECGRLLLSGRFCHRPECIPLFCNDVSVHVRPAGNTAQTDKFVVLIGRIGNLAVQGLKTFLEPAFRKKVFSRLHVVITRMFPQPGIRPGMAHRLCIEIEDPILKLLIAELRTEILDTERKIRGSRAVLLLEHVLHGIRLHESGFHFVHLTEAGVKPDIAEIIAEKEGAEAVDGRDLRRRKKR